MLDKRAHNPVVAVQALDRKRGGPSVEAVGKHEHTPFGPATAVTTDALVWLFLFEFHTCCARPGSLDGPRHADTRLGAANLQRKYEI
jgi:hypothetical protein